MRLVGFDIKNSKPQIISIGTCRRCHAGYQVLLLEAGWAEDLTVQLIGRKLTKPVSKINEDGDIRFLAFFSFGPTD